MVGDTVYLKARVGDQRPRGPFTIRGEEPLVLEANGIIVHAEELGFELLSEVPELSITPVWTWEDPVAHDAPIEPWKRSVECTMREHSGCCQGVCPVCGKGFIRGLKRHVKRCCVLNQ